MMLVVLLETLHIGLIVGGVALLLIAGFLVLHFTLFASLRYKRQVRELIRKFEYLHALLFGQDSQYINRIEQISSTNLLYADTNAMFSKRFRDVRDSSDASAQASINKLKDLLAEHDYKGLKEALPEARKVIENFDIEVNSLHQDLKAVIRPEEDCRQQAFNLREEFRHIKNDYYVRQADLSLVSETFAKVFRKLDEKFVAFDEKVDTADYEDAKEMLPNMKMVIESLGKAIQELPTICTMIQSVIPEKIAYLENAYQEMQHADYPLSHLMVNSSVEDIKRQLAEITKQVQGLSLTGVNQSLDGIVSRIDEILESFDHEKEARIAYEGNKDDAYAFASTTDQKYIDLCNALPEIKKMYVISEEEEAKFIAIKESIETADSHKRSLDTIYHSATPQPYSLLLERMNVLNDSTHKASDAIASFFDYLRSLKSDSEAALATVKSYFTKLKEAENLLRLMNMQTLCDKYEPLINEAYSDIDKIYGSLKTPIDVAYINEHVLLLVDNADKICNEIASLYEVQLKTQAAFVYANRKRQHLGEVHAYLSQEEGIFWRGDIEKCYRDVSTFISELREQE